MPIYKEIQVDLDYDFYIKQDYDGNKGQSCIAHHRVELKDIHDRFGGMPETYTYDNTEISQLWWDKDQVDYDDLGESCGMCQCPDSLLNDVLRRHSRGIGRCCSGRARKIRRATPS